MQLVGRGHAAIRATHDKTIELAADVEISTRATCVVAVGVTASGAPLTGPVRITLRAGAASFELTARANPSWVPGGPAVIRRSPLRLPGTFATHASAAAHELPPELVTALRDPVVEVVADVLPIPGPPVAVLFALDPDRPLARELAAELAAADVVVAEDEDAARAMGERIAGGGVEVVGRTLVVAVRELPGRTVTAALRGVLVETVGLPPRLAAAAASPSRGPVLFAPDDAAPRDVLRGAPAGVRIALRTTADRLPAVLAQAAELRGTGGGTAVQPYAPPVRVGAGEPLELASKDDVYVCLDVAPESTALDPAVRAAIDGLLADGVATRAVARALASLSGWDRRRAYDAVLEWPRPGD